MRISSLILILTLFFLFPHLNGSLVISLHGTSRSGKSTVSRLMKKNYNYGVITSLYTPFLLETLYDAFPKEICFLKKTLEENNIRHALTRNLFFFKERIENKEKEKSQKIAKGIQRVFEDPKIYAVHKKKFKTYCLDTLKQKIEIFPYIISDISWHLNQKELDRLFPNTDFKSILLYCPLSTCIKRLKKENEESIIIKNLSNYRFFNDVFISFFYFYELNTHDYRSIDTLDKSALLLFFDTLAYYLQNKNKKNDSPFLMQEISIEDLEKYRNLILEKFKGQEILYLAPKISYDLVIHMKDLTPEEAAMQINAFVHKCNPKN